MHIQFNEKKKVERKQPRHHRNGWRHLQQVVRLNKALQVINRKISAAEQRIEFWETLIDFYEKNQK